MASTSTIENLGRTLSREDFNAETFVCKIANSGGEDDLIDIQRTVQQIADETALNLKKNVYKNYTQFIETAKEISILEGEMYQLSHMLSEQKLLLDEMKEMSLVSDEVDARQSAPGLEDESDGKPGEGAAETRQNVASLLENVEGCSRVTEVPGRLLVHHGDLMELDPETFSNIEQIHVYLLNDSLLFATLLPHGIGPVKFKFQNLYELDSLAVVNARDIGHVKNAFKILMFPDTRMLKCDSAKEKRFWLEILEETKKKKSALESRKRESVVDLREQRKSVVDPRVNNRKSIVDSRAADRRTDEPDSSPALSSVIDLSLLHEDWVREVPEDLDVFVAQRDFESAVEKIAEINEHLKRVPKSVALTEYRARIDHRVKHLTDALVQELRVSPERSMRGGPRAARRAVTQLIKLGQSARACRLFLLNREAIITYNLKQLKLEGAVTVFVRKLCEVFFSSLIDTGREFDKAFEGHYGCYSEFVVWCEGQIRGFVAIFTSQILQPDTSEINKSVSLGAIAECVRVARRHSDRLIELGLELTYILNDHLRVIAEKAITEHRDQLLEAAKHRAADDTWRPENLSTRDDVDAYLTELSESGLVTIRDYVDSDWLSLTTNTTQFSRAFLIYVDNLCKIYTEELHCAIIDSLADVLKFQLKHVERALTTQQFIKEHAFVLSNGGFIVDVVLRRTEEKLSACTGNHSYQFYQIHAAYKRIKQNAAQKV
ncbi:exocyst complex component 8-like [Tubulanus polymorphus]|uniref:exocyst complex component 8-like n=1 Tax=Tubulanus polymorphus TaxID=672921 RepID=UPI003DA5AE2F